MTSVTSSVGFYDVAMDAPSPLSSSDRERLEDVANSLRELGEICDDLALDLLRTAAERGGERPLEEKRLSQARRSIEKAMHILDGLVDESSAVDE